MFAVSRVRSVCGGEETSDRTGILESALAIRKDQPRRHKCDSSPVSLCMCVFGCTTVTFHCCNGRLSCRGRSRDGKRVYRSGGRGSRKMSKFSCWSIGKFLFFLRGHFSSVCRVFDICSLCYFSVAFCSAPHASRGRTKNPLHFAASNVLTRKSYRFCLLCWWFLLLCW